MKSIVFIGIGLALLAARSLTAAELRGHVVDQKGRPVADAVLLAIPQDTKNAQRAKPPTDAMDQVDKQFVPYVKPILVGSTVHFPNSDNIRHQVYSFSPAKKFELPLYSGTSAQPVIFDKPGVVVLGCNIHDWMVGYIYVSETPYFAKTGTTGAASINELPPGEYLVRVWHPSLEGGEETTQRLVTLLADGPTSAEWQLRLKPNIRVPRAPAAASPAYP
jgi:plastocyanin